MQFNEPIEIDEFIRQADKNKAYRVTFLDEPAYAGFLLTNGGHYLFYENPMLCGEVLDLTEYWDTWKELGLIEELNRYVHAQNVAGIYFDYFFEHLPANLISKEKLNEIGDKIREINEIDLTEDGAELDWCGLHIEWTPEGEVWDLDLIDFDDLSYANDFPTDSEVEVRIVSDGEDYAFLINGMITALNPIENYEGYNVIVLEEI